ncbi:hypothetical protein KIW84_021060 [Lathyrus oleraceus]|uniref:Uncharacterized protein n=1 Tax=Pisum sativum TaxID=3888 RepID=A0A9D4Y824_PEA|nr:hypothetical protein KIW84_021060 [Pisum sativum]
MWLYLTENEKFSEFGSETALDGVKHPYDGGVRSVCARRLMQYLYHQRQRPSDNSIAYWRKLIAAYLHRRAAQKLLYNKLMTKTSLRISSCCRSARTCSILVKLLDFTQDINFAMEQYTNVTYIPSCFEAGQ